MDRPPRSPHARVLPFLGFLLALGILLGVGLLVYRDTRALLDAQRSVEASHQVIEDLQGILGDTEELAAIRRTHALTGNPADLADWEAVRVKLEQRRAFLTLALVHDPTQVVRRLMLRPLVDARLEQLESALREAREHGFDRERESERVIEGTALERRVQQLANEMIAEERRVLGVREREEGRRAARMIQILMLGFASAAALLFAVVLLLRREIVQRARSEVALAASEGRLAAILSSLGEGVIAVDTSGRVAQMNPVAASITGRPAAECAGLYLDAVLQLRDEKTRAPLENPALPVLTRGQGAEAPQEGLLTDGEGCERAVSVMTTPMRDPAGRLEGAVTVLRDVTRERALQAQFRRILEATPDAIVISDKRGRVVLVNDQVTPMLGYSREEIVGQSVELLVPERFRAGHVCERGEYEDRPAARPMGHGRTLYARRKDGSVFPADISLSPLETPEQRLTIAAVRDVSVRVRAEAELRRAKDATEAANRELEAFSYSVAHDLRTPLRSIDGFSQALLEDYGDKLDSEGQNYLQRVRSAAQRMAHLIDDLLSLSRVSRSAIARERVDLSRLAREIMARLREADPSRNAEVRVEDGLSAEADPRLIGIVLENLLGNAWKFTARCPRALVEVSAVRDAERPTFCVRDNGAGFDMAYVGKLFGAFQRLHRDTEFQGTGIGLATVQRIVHRHGGRVWAEGAVDQGAAFYVAL